MASRTGKTTESTKPARPARKKAAPSPAASARIAAVPGAGALIRAGLKALGDAPADMVARQKRIFEVLLGVGQSPAWTAPAKASAPAGDADPFGKFEDVFDQRVARSLERLGMPSPQQLRELIEQVRELNELLRAAQPKAPRKR
jgi:hypothetical protein